MYKSTSDDSTSSDYSDSSVSSDIIVYTEFNIT